MAELDSIPQKQTIEIETVKLDENLFNTILEARDLRLNPKGRKDFFLFWK